MAKKKMNPRAEKCCKHVNIMIGNRHTKKREQQETQHGHRYWYNMHMYELYSDVTVAASYENKTKTDSYIKRLTFKISSDRSDDCPK